MFCKIRGRKCWHIILKISKRIQYLKDCNDCMMKISHSAGLVKLLYARISLQIGKQKTNMDIAPFIKEPVLFNQNQGDIKKKCFLFSELFPKIGTFLAFLQTSNFYLKDQWIQFCFKSTITLKITKFLFVSRLAVSSQQAETRLSRQRDEWWLHIIEV